MAFRATGAPKALLEAPKGGSNIVTGIGLYTSGNNRRAVAALWRAGANSMMDDVRFLGGHGTPLPDGSRERPYNSNQSADPNPSRHWDSQFPSLWVCDGGGGVFLDIWTPSTFAQAGMMVCDTQTEGRAYQISSEHHVRNEIEVRNAAHWSFYALQTEEERGESGFALPIEIDSSRDITFANFHSYRVISAFQPFPTAVKVNDSRDIHFRNFHCDSNSKASFDSSITDANNRLEIRQHEFANLDLTGVGGPGTQASSPTMARGAKMQKLAGGFYNISGGAVDARGNFYFVDAHWQRIYEWNDASRQLCLVSDAPLEPANLAIDHAGNLMVVSYADHGMVYSLTPSGEFARLKSSTQAAGARDLYLPVSDWRLNKDSLGHPAGYFVSSDTTAALAVGQDFLDGETSWGVESSPPIRSFGLGRAIPGRSFYITDESQIRTWSADVNPDGSLHNFRLFAEQGGEGVTSDARGNVHTAAGQIYVYDGAGHPEGAIEVS